MHYLNAAAYGNGIYVVGGRSGLMLTSTNLTTWTPVAGFPPLMSINGITHGNGVFVAVGQSALGIGETAIATSSDGVQWTSQLSGVQGQLHAVAFGADSFVAAGEPHLLLSSTNAINWKQHAASVDAFLGVTHGNGSFVAVGGFYTALPRGVAVQSGGRPQLCLQSIGFGPSWSPGFWLLLTAEGDRAYRLQSSPQLPAISWTDVNSVILPSGPWPHAVRLSDPTALVTGQRFYQAVSP
jgi:hypothetical protein